MTAARIPTVPVSPTALRLLGARIIDGTGRPPIEDGEVHIVQGVFAYVGPRRTGEIDDAHDALIVDLSGKTILPGFFDAHVHLSMGLETDFTALLSKFPEERSLSTAATMRDTLMAGVTTVRDLGGLTPGFRNLVAGGALLGPRAHLAIDLLGR